MFSTAQKFLLIHSRCFGLLETGLQYPYQYTINGSSTIGNSRSICLLETSCYLPLGLKWFRIRNLKFRTKINCKNDNPHTGNNIMVGYSKQRCNIIRWSTSKLTQCTSKSVAWYDLPIWNRRESIISTTSAPFDLVILGIFKLLPLFLWYCNKWQHNMVMT